ncbi:MAG: pyruvate kinase [Proteobacteria bacterium]|jgi:pyruvate kinase|nr:pyruvate kinase [Alphaproteobacteria bacterium]NCC02755.1 pyruvate kinase [Pseudomonadota bacterium]
MRHRYRQTKIVATLGPASSTKDQIRSLFDTGVDVFRLNFSHGSAEDHRARMRAIREIEAEVGRPIAVLADLQGPKLRLGTFRDDEITLQVGQRLRLDRNPEAGDETRVCLPHPEIFEAIRPGSELLLDDGKVRLRVEDCGQDFALTVVEAGTKLSNRKGVNVPNVVLPLSPLTEKDRADLAVALEIGADWIALSFVQRPEDVIEAKRLVDGRAAVLAKLEKPSAIKALIPILEHADGVMVARGDLGVEMPPENVPRTQKRILREARRIGKPVIVATQMLESMISSPTPTRAEASDVATAVYDGADAVMLSAETASGNFPIQAVAIMDRILIHTQEDMAEYGGILADRPILQHTSADAITAAARQVAETIEAKVIITYTTSGSTTLRAARERPQVVIMGLTPNLKTARRLALSYGVHPVHTKDAESFKDMVQKAVRLAREAGLATVGDKLVITAGVPFGTPGSTNILRIAQIEGLGA